MPTPSAHPFANWVPREFAAASALLLVAGWLAAAPSIAEEPMVPDDTAIVEVALPAGATVRLDGVDRQSQDRFVFPRLERNRHYLSSLKVRYANGTETELSLVLRGGQFVRAPVAEPSQERPELVLQTSSPGSDDLSADGRYAATTSGAFAVLWDVASGRQLRVYGGFKESVRCVAFRPGADQIVAGSFDGSAALFDVPSGQRLRTLNNEVTFHCLAFSPDGRLLLTGGYQLTSGNEKGLARLWDVQSGRRLRDFVGHSEWINCVAFSPDGRKAVTGSKDRTVILWDVESGRRLQTLAGHVGEINAVAFGAAGDQVYVAAGNSDFETKVTSGEVVAWSLEGVRRGQRQSNEFYQRLSLGRDGRELFVFSFSYANGAYSSRATIFQADDLGKFREHVFGKSPEKKVELADDEMVVRSVRLFAAGITMKARKTAARLLFPVSFADNGRGMLFRDFLCEGEPGRLARRFELGAKDAEYRFAEYRLTGDGSRVMELALRKSPDVYDLAAYDAADGKLLNRFTVGDRRHLAVSSDGRRALTFDHNSASLWDVDSAQEVHRWEKSDAASSFTFALSPDGKRAASGHSFEEKVTEGGSETTRRGQEVALWDPADGRKIWRSQPIDWLDEIQAVAFSPDGRHLIAGGEGKSGTPLGSNGDEHREAFPVGLIFDAATGKMLHTWRHGSQVYSWDWRYINGELTRQNEQGQFSWRHIDGVGCSPDGLLAWSWQKGSGTIVVVDVTTGATLRTITDSASYNRPEFAADGRHLVLDPGDWTAAFLDVAIGREVLRVARTHQGDWVAATPDGLFDGSEKGRQQVAYRIGGGLNVVPVDRFFQDFYRPDLFHEVIRGRRPMPEVKIGQTLPPTIRILSPQSGTVESATAALEVEAVDRGGGVSRLALFHNGAHVLAGGQSRKEGARVLRTFQVPLIQGENRLKVTAASSDGSWESEPAEIVLRFERPLQKSELYVVAVGISKYQEASFRLGYASNDAKALADLFQKRGPTLYAKVHVRALLDESATRAAILAALKESGSQSRAQDTLVVFLAGHGTMLGQRYYFIPCDVARKADRLEDDLRNQGLPADLISEHLGSAKALKRILVLDTCASGGALLVASRSRSSVSLRSAIERLARAQGVFTLAASAASEEAKESKDLGHGVLTYTLLAGLGAVKTGPLEGKAIQPTSPDRLVDVLEWFNFADGNVRRLSERFFGKSQDVQMSGQGASFPVLPIEE